MLERYTQLRKELEMSIENSTFYKAHKRAGFPALDRNTQLNILLKRDYSALRNLVAEVSSQGFPLAILKEYITISKQELKDYLKSVDYVQQMLDSYHPTSDGIWLIESEQGFKMFDRERGVEHEPNLLSSEDEVLNIYVGILGWCCP